MSSISAPSSYHRGYAVQTALLFSQEKRVVCEWQHYHLEIEQRGEVEEQPYCLTIATRGQQPHIEQSFSRLEMLQRFLREYELPPIGWFPNEFANRD